MKIEGKLCPVMSRPMSTDTNRDFAMVIYIRDCTAFREGDVMMRKRGSDKHEPSGVKWQYCGMMREDAR